MLLTWIDDSLGELRLTTEHAASSYGRPVLVLDGQAYGPADTLPDGRTAAAAVREALNEAAELFCGLTEVSHARS